MRLLLPLTGIMVLAIFAGLVSGSVNIPLADVVSILLGEDSGIPESWKVIILQVRLPRTLAAALVGGVLATGGVACQGIFRNPLSEPYLLGISSGAALGATVAVVLGGYVIGPFAFLGAITISAFVFISTGRGAFRVPSTLLLSGIAISLLCQAFIWLLLTSNRDQIQRITFWTLGSFSSITWNKTIFLALSTLPVAVVLIVCGRVLDILSTGYDSAHGLGLRPTHWAFIILGLTALGTATAVASVGSIGFVGLMIPHVMRLLGGPLHRKLTILSWFGGAILLVFADIAARTIALPGEIPVSVVTALPGAPVLLILSRGKRAEGRLDG